MHFRTGTLNDVEVIATLHTESWRSAYAGIMPGSYLDGPLLEERTALWADRLAPGRAGSGEDLLLVAEEDGAVEGFVYLAPQPDGRVLLDNLHVRPARKRSGIGRLLMGRAFTWAAECHPGRAVYLEVLRDNAPAIAFYERCGGSPAREFMELLPAGFELPVIEYVWTPSAVASWN